MRPTCRMLLAAAMLALPASTVSRAEVRFDAPFRATLAGKLPRGVALADFNGDGVLDLVTSQNQDALFTINLGVGEGKFGPRVDIPCGTGPSGVAAGDVNGDGRPDIVTVNSSSNVSLMIGNGDGTLATHVEYATYGSGANRVVRIADLDHDGRGDVIASNGGSTFLSIFPGMANGTLGPRIDVLASSSILWQLADLNGDGWLDLLSLDNSSSPKRIVARAGAPGFAFGPLQVTNTGYTLSSLSLNAAVVGDFDEDGKLDLATAEWQPYRLAIWHGRGDGTFDPPAYFPLRSTLYTGRLRSADFDGDGHLDLVLFGAPSVSGGLVVFYRGHGNGALDLPVEFPAANFPLAGEVADLDADGHPDLVLASNYGSAAAVMPGRAGAGFGPSTWLSVGSATGYDAGPRALSIGDLDGDGRLDLAVLTGIPDTLAAFLNLGVESFGPPIRSPIEHSSYLELTDLDHDGHADLVTTQRLVPGDMDSDSTVTVHHGNADGTFGPGTLYFVGRGPSALEVEDVNGDHNEDLLALYGYDLVGGMHQGDAHAMAVLLGNGDGTFQSPMSFEIGPSARIFTTADLNGDGHPDVISGSSSLNSEITLLGHGDGTFMAGPTHSVPGMRGGVVGDVNGDGIPDLAVDHSTSSDADSVSVLLGVGDGSFTPHFDLRYPGFFSALPLALEDMDLDGHADLVLLTPSNAVSVWAGDGGSFTPPPFEFGLASYPYDPEIEDMNGDGKPDVVVSDASLDRVTLVFNRSISSPTAVPVGPSQNPTQLSGLRIQPNPSAGDRLTVEFALPERGAARVELFDLSGRRLRSLDVSSASVGPHQVDIGEGKRLAPGLYLLRLTHAGRLATARAVVLR